MRCGKCKADGVSTVHVRQCYGIQPPHKFTTNPKATSRFADWGVSKNDPPSLAQINYVIGLQGERILPSDYVLKTVEMLKAMDKDEVSSDISLLKTFPQKAGPKGKDWSMPAGRYALRIGGDTAMSFSAVDRQDLVPFNEGEVWFFQVDKPTDGRWAGYTFIKRLIGAPGDYRKVDLPRDARITYLNLIEQDANAAMTLYGKEARVCGRCSSPLTTPESRARGIGPVCLGKLGW